MIKDRFLAIGLMSGTSMDGIDCALIESDAHSAKIFGKAVSLSYSPALRNDISQAMNQAVLLGYPSKQNELIDQLTDRLTLLHAEAVQQILRENNLTSDLIDVVGFHGQTLLHRPDEGWSWQIGDGQLLANHTGISVVNDFRRKDVEQGGQGAPLVPIYHQALVKAMARPEYPVAIVNIGGVGNITWLGGANEDEILAFDTGPGNALLDDWIRHHTGENMDIDGAYAAKGVVDQGLLEQWLLHPYFSKTPPKSLDRHTFVVKGLEGLSLEKGAATLLAFTVKSIEQALQLCPMRPKHIYICGGGRHNKTLMAKLAELNIPVSKVEELEWRGDFLEAEAFAFLACRHLRNLPITYPLTTGTPLPTSGGKLYRPE